jgi:RHS repeat-associated protein
VNIVLSNLEINKHQLNDAGSTGSGLNEKMRFFYHPDHVGSTSYITDANGEVYQHLEYFAFGETFVEEHSNTWRTPYLFNGKELDDETGLYYYDARYYDPVTSVWQSVDPMTDKYPDLSAYSYCANNPINYVDPDGRYFVGTDGNPVTISIQDGKLSLGANASPDLKRMATLINKTGSQKAMDQFKKVGSNNTKVHFKFSNEIVRTGRGGVLFGLHQAHDINGNPLKWNSGTGTFNGDVAFITDAEGNIAYNEASITVYEETIKKYTDNEADKEKEMVSTKAHEDEHDLNKKDIKAIKERQEGKKNKRNVEKKATKVGGKVRREIERNNKRNKNE